jgi:hypothetical protein
MSLLHNASIDEIKKQDRFYLRYYRTVIEARKLNQEIYGDQLAKGNVEMKIEHPLRVACFTEQIKNQKIEDYHMTWLVGLLHDTKEDELMIYSERIDDVLKDLLPLESQKVKSYIDQLTSDESLSKGEKKRGQILKMDELELIPCWIRIFDKYDNCRRFRNNPVGKKKSEIDGYCSIAYLCYHRGCERFEEIRNNLQPEIRKLYEDICTELGGL